MKLGTKIILAALGSLAITVTVGLIIQRTVIRNQGIELTRQTMHATVIEAESIRDSVAALSRRNAFDRDKLIAEFKQSGDLRGSTIYGTIPVAAAWQAIGKVAEKEGYDFRVPKHLPRNPKNTPTPEEAEILKHFESNKGDEYFKVDAARNEIIFARPIILTADCLVCHGDPKTSPTGDGKDIAGMTMEGWKAGEVHGAFVLKAKLENVDRVVAAGMGKTLGWVLPVCALVTLGFYFLNRQMIVKPLTSAIANLHESSEQTTIAAGQIAAASTTLAEGASEQAASIEETSAALEEMASMTKRNADHARNAKGLAAQTRAAADTGASDMTDMKQAMNEIKVSSSEVAKIVKDIDEIAFQTNILALNAAVEAARAGDAGMGFAVVADEVRNLAQRSAKSAKETAAKIEDAIAKSERGVQISAKVAASLQEIVSKVRQVDELIAGIATASTEQNQGISQVNIAVTQMDQVTQSNAASAEESASAAEELNAQAAALKESVHQLLYLMGTEVQAVTPTAGPNAPESPTSTAQTSAQPLPPKAPTPHGPANRNGRVNGHGPAPVTVGGREHLTLPGDNNFKDF